MTDLSARYGRSRSAPRWVWYIAAAVGIVIGIGWAAWVAMDDVPSYQTEVFGYEVVDDELTTITINVYRTEDVALSCEVYAQAESKAIVGETVVDIPATPRDTRVSADIVTEHRATTAVVRACEPA